MFLFDFSIVKRWARVGQPDIPPGLTCNWLAPDLTLSWDETEKTTSYQLTCSENNKDWEELYSDKELSYTYQPPEGLRYYKVRARNAKGFSEWSDVVEFEPVETD